MRGKTLTEDLERGVMGNFYRSPDTRIMKLVNVLNNTGELPYDLFVEWYSSEGRFQNKGRLFVGALPFIRTYRFKRIPAKKVRDLIEAVSVVA